MAHKKQVTEELIEQEIQGFYAKRDELGNEILKLKDECVQLVEQFFADLNIRVMQEVGRSDEEIDAVLGDLQNLVAQKKDLDIFMGKLSLAGIAMTADAKPSIY